MGITRKVTELALKGFAYCKPREPEPADIMAAKVEPRHVRNTVEIHLSGAQCVVAKYGCAVRIVDGHIGL
jgi:hypothetical protein